MVTEGSAAPDFTLPRDGGGEVTLSGLKGKKVVLYFYPKDDTSGCTDRGASTSRTPCRLRGRGRRHPRRVEGQRRDARQVPQEARAWRHASVRRR